MENHIIYFESHNIKYYLNISDASNLPSEWMYELK